MQMVTLFLTPTSTAIFGDVNEPSIVLSFVTDHKIIKLIIKLIFRGQFGGATFVVSSFITGRIWVFIKRRPKIENEDAYNNNSVQSGFSTYSANRPFRGKLFDKQM